MIQMNLFIKQNQTYRCKKQAYGSQRETGGGGINQELRMNIHTTIYDIQKTKLMASGPITSWQIDGETVETVSDLIFGGSKITADGDCMKFKDAYSLEESL